MLVTKQDHYPKFITALRQRIVDLLSDPAHFQTWLLTSFLPDEEVGMATICNDCPVARFLKSEGITVDVFNTGIENIDRHDLIFYAESPELEWIGKFTQIVDTQRIDAQGEQVEDYWGSITAREALGVLEAIAP